MKAGKLRHRITIQRRVDTLDAYGQPSTGWADYVTTWASVDPLSARELLSGSQVSQEVTHKIRTRFHAGVTAGMRVLFGARVFDIRGVTIPREIESSLEILATEGASGG